MKKAKKKTVRKTIVPAKATKLPPYVWNGILSDMPITGRFEVLRIYDEVYRHSADSELVIEPISGRMFTPTAWRPGSRRRAR